MTETNRRSAIASEIRRGRDALQEARVLRDAGLVFGAITRLYYAIFHHVTALLLIEGIEVRSHRALPGLLGQHVVGRR